MAKILVIDDNADFLEMIRQILALRGGHQVVVSAEGTDGLAKAVADPPDLAIVDVMMPGVSGYEICRRLRANPRTASVPIIVLTARGQPVDRQAAMDVGADDYMAKPVPMKELLERVNDLLAKRSAETTHVLAGMVVLLSLRGGVGVTTLAVNLAVTLARARDEAVCLVDLCPSSGHVALHLGLRPEPNWSDLVKIGVPDAEFVEALLLQHASGLRVLASPMFPVVGQGLSRAVVETTLRVLRQQFAAIVVDAPPVLDEAAMAVLDAATVVGLVVTPEAPSIQTAVGTMRALGQWSDKFQVILNQITPGANLPTEAIERALKRSLLSTIPFDPAQAQALGHGAPLALHSPASPLAEAVRRLVQET
jgi:pilus assembly protein CpaE